MLVLTYFWAKTQKNSAPLEDTLSILKIKDSTIP